MNFLLISEGLRQRGADDVSTFFRGVEDVALYYDVTMKPSLSNIRYRDSVVGRGLAPAERILPSRFADVTLLILWQFNNEHQKWRFFFI